MISASKTTQAFTDPEATKLETISRMIEVSAILVINLAKNNISQIHPEHFSYGHQLLNELLAVQAERKLGLRNVCIGMHTVFLNRAVAEHPDNPEDAILQTLGHVIAAGVIENARQLDLRLN